MSDELQLYRELGGGAAYLRFLCVFLVVWKGSRDNEM